MSAILLNAGANKVTKVSASEAIKKNAEAPKKPIEPKKFVEASKIVAEAPKLLAQTPKIPLEPNEIKSTADSPTAEVKDDEESRDKRRATGRSVAIVIFLSFMCLALYHVIQRKTTVLAGVLVPALILFTYLFFVIHVSTREKKRRKNLDFSEDLELSVQSEMKKQELHKKVSTVSSPSSISSASIPSTSGTSLILTKNIAKHSIPQSSSQVKLDPKASKVIIDPKAKKVPPPFKKAQSQSHIQVKSNQSTHIAIEHETKKLKKSRSFDKNNLVEPRHMIDNKKIKTKH